MKKRLFNSKRKILGLAIWLVIVICIGYVAKTYSFATSVIEAEFSNIARGTPASEVYYYRELYDGEFNTTENLIPSHFNCESKFPAAIALYDKNGELVHTNGTLISFFDDDLGFGGLRYCYLDEYLTEEEFKNLLQFAKDNGRIEIKEFKYYQSEKGDIVPVECVFETRYKEKNVKTLELVLNESYTGELREPGENNSMWLHLHEQDYYVSDSQNKLYRQLIEELKSDDIKDGPYENFLEWIEKDYHGSKGGGGGTDDYYFHTENITINGEPYFILYCSEYDLLPQIWHKYSYELVAGVLFFLFIGLVFAYEVSKYYDKNKVFEESKTAFISAMTHEMKTPIAIIQNQCECVLENIAPEKNEEYLKSIYDETEKMNKLVTDMLQYNRIAQSNELNKEKCNLSDIVKEEIEKYKKQFKLHEKSVTLNIKETAIVKCDRNLISLVVANMLSNTIKHTENGGEVIVTVKDGVEGYKVSVYNSGSAVPENEKDKIWSVLYKTDKSRTDRDKSSGVGLAVSAKILDLHKANYGCENVKDGVKFYFSIR